MTASFGIPPRLAPVVLTLGPAIAVLLLLAGCVDPGPGRVWLWSSALVLITALTLTLRAWVVKPLQALHAALRRMARGDSEARPSLRGDAPLAGRGDACNDAGAHMQALVGELRRGERSEPAGILAILADVSAPRRAEEELRRVRNRLAEAQAIAGLGIWEMDLETGRAACSEEACRILGIDRQQQGGADTWLGKIHLDDRERVARELAQALAGSREYEVEYRVVRSEGATAFIYSRARLEYDKQGAPVRLLGVVQDITQRKAAEEMTRLAATAFETHEGIVVTDDKGNILRVNKAFTEITGYRAEQAIGNNPRFLNSGRQDAAFYCGMWDSLAQDGRWEGEIWNRRRDGDVYPQWQTITAVRSDAGEVSHYVSVFFDLSEIKAQQERIERTASEEQALGELLRLSLKSLAIDTFLEQALDLLLRSVPWLRTPPRGGIFLSEDAGEKAVLRLTASRDLDAATPLNCQRVPFGHCLCGRAAQDQAIQFCDGVDERHATRGEGIGSHCHFCIPLVSGDSTLGVLVLFLPEGYQRSEREDGFLARVADALSAGIIRRRVEAEIEYQALHDTLTDLPNRRLLLDRLRHDLARNRRRRAQGALLFIDLDHFKKVNDALGHLVGDDLLVQVAGRLVEQVRAEDTVARLGGDEFVVLLSQLATGEAQAGYEARMVAEKLRNSLAQPFYLDRREHQLTPSIGIVLFPSGREAPEEVLRYADTAMYRAKEAGRNAIRFFQPDMQRAADRRFKLENDLRHAIQRREFSLHLQPQVDSQARIVGAEGLLRWSHGKHGPVAPADFIPLAEETGLILPIGEWVLGEACRLLKAWEGDPLLARMRGLAINVSPRQFHQADFVTQVRAILERTGADPRRLELELTEGILVDQVKATVDKMNELRALGVGFSIDDFGTGYSSLAYLKRLPLSKLKIDQSFVRDLEDDPNDAAIVDTIIAMARHLKLDVIAEGVETRQQHQMLDMVGCETYQGYHFGRPMPAADFAAFVQARGNLRLVESSASSRE